jgi:hypothetical protein
MNRLAALALIAVSALLGGCATYDEYSYRDGYYDDRYDDRYYDDGYYDRRYDDRYYSSSYDVGYRYYAPDYVHYHSYYSALWPTYRYWYDPYWSPGFYYGVTYFPRTYFGLNVGWHSWPYYAAYSPYRYSHADNYYDWAGLSRDRAASRQRYYGNNLPPRFGSASNEAQMMANRSGVRDRVGGGYYGGSAQPGSFVAPDQARAARARGQRLPFEQSDWNYDPYGRDSQEYRGFTGPNDGRARGGYGRGGSGESSPSFQRGGDRDAYTRGRVDGYVAPTRGGNERYQRAPIRDERSLQSQEIAPDRGRYTRSRGGYDTRTSESGEGFLPRQTNDRHNPVFERHYNDAPQAQPGYEPRSRQIYRGRSQSPTQDAFQGAPSRGRGYEPGAYPQSQGFQRAEPRSQPRYEMPQRRMEPRSEPRFEMPQRSHELRSAPSPDMGRSDFGRGSSSDSSSSSSSSSSSGRGSRGSSSRGQLERIIRDDG